MDTLPIDDAGPFPVARPADLAELGELVRRAVADRTAVYPVGGRTMLGLGNPPSKAGTAVDTRALAGVIDYPARDMTVTVGAGITLSQLDAILRAENQRLPIDVPLPDRATLGGAVSANASGARRFGQGTLRDYVIGIGLVNDTGAETKAGGRVVKNVAGYDLCKLYTGALGTLGVVSHLTLKLKPRPEASAFVGVACADADLGGLLEVLHRTRTQPVAVELLGGTLAAAAPEPVAGLAAHPWVVLVGYEEKAETVAWQVPRLAEELRDLKLAGTADVVAAEPLWAWLRDQPLLTSAAVRFRATLLPGAVADFCRLAARHAPRAQLRAHAANGIVTGHLPEPADFGTTRGVLETLRRAAVAAKGNLTVPHCPPAWKRDIPVWGEPRGDAALARTVRQKLDPNAVFNPGRFD